MERSSIELLCVPFLDTDVSELTVEANDILQKRGYPKFVIKFLRFFCGIGLWTQGFTWEEYSLGWIDIIFGYSLLSILIGIFVIFLSLVSSLAFIKLGLVILAVGVLLAAILFIIFKTAKVNGN